MGQYNCYFGIYLKCKNERISKKIKEVSLSCLKCEIDGIELKDSFCSECGSKLVEKTNYKEKFEWKVDPYDVTEEIEEQFFWRSSDKEYDYLALNIGTDTEIELTCGEYLLLMDKEFWDKWENKKQIFIKQHEKNIQIIKEAYGEDNVEVCFGIINLWG